MKQIPLTQNKFALIDDDDFYLISKFKWCVDYKPTSRKWYASTYGGERKTYMHRLIMTPEEGMEVDHINGNPLDNRRNNLRIVTHARNLQNRVFLSKNNKSGIRGVYWNKIRKCWMVQVVVGGKYRVKGGFKELKDAEKEIKRMRVQLIC